MIRWNYVSDTDMERLEISWRIRKELIPDATCEPFIPVIFHPCGWAWVAKSVECEAMDKESKDKWTYYKAIWNREKT